MSTTTHPPVVYYQDSNILIRRFDEATDKVMVHRVFEKSMKSLAPIALEQFITSRSALCIGTLASAVLIHLLVGRFLFPAVTTFLFDYMGTKIFLRRDPPAGTAVAYWGLASIVSIAWVAYCYHSIKQSTSLFFSSYIDDSIKSDLSNIPSVYFSGNGNFLVAVDRASGRIVGCVGAQHHHQNRNMKEQEKGGNIKKADKGKQEKNKTDGSITNPTKTTTTSNANASSSSSTTTTKKEVYELRRMVVDPSYHRRAVGRRLVSCLEASLREQQQQQQQGQSSDRTSTNTIRFYLTCTNIQRPAHKMYERSGFVRLHTYRPKEFCNGLFLYWSGISLCHYEKEMTLLLSPSIPANKKEQKQQWSHLIN